MGNQVVSVDGLKDLEKSLAKLSTSAGKGVLRRVGKKGLGIFIDSARDKVAVGRGDLRDSLGVSTKLSDRQKPRHRRMVKPSKNSVEIFAGADALPHAHLVEFGTGERVVESTGQHVGSVAPQPFLRPAWDEKGDDVLKYISRELWVEIEKTIARAEKRAAKKAGK